MCYYIDQLVTQVIHPPSAICTTEVKPIPDDFLIPRVILWNPLLTFSFVFKNFGGLRCASCNKLCETLYWNDGSSSQHQPRLIHDVEDFVLLVSAVYACEEGHKILAHDERILRMLPCKSMIPFILLHKIGFTTNFVNFCGSLCQSGMNFRSLESVIIHIRWQYHLSREQLYLCYVKHSSIASTNEECIRNFPSFQDFGMKYLPSDDIICKCFLSNFIEEECAFISAIQSVHPGEVLSFDHTFKIASNIGYLRDDSKWVCQYDSAFIVFNGDGKVVTWQFTRGTGFDNVRSILKNVKERPQSSSITTVYVDNCCQWRRKIQELFGSGVTVFLDIFHAVQRITRKIPKRHPFYAACVHDLRLVFRSPGDQGDRRTKPTPQSSELLKNMNAFTAKWKNISYDEQCILTKETLAEIEKLKIHVIKGCLSGIPIGGGTNKNEAFHRYINTFFHKSRIGILLAYALMMTIICHFNTNTKHNSKPMFKPIVLDSSTSEKKDLEKMGIMDSSKNDSDLTWVQEDDDNDHDFILLEYIIRVSLSQLNMYKALKSQTKTASQLWKYIPFMQMLPESCFQNLLSPLQESEVHKERLKNNITAWNFDLVPVQPDGNCFFTSIALSLIQDINKCKSILDSINVDVNGPITVLSSKLREVIVQEWLGPNRSDYEGFLIDQDKYEHEVLKFLQDGHYNSDLGNTMPLAMASALNVSIVLLTSIPSSPVFFVSPPTNSNLVLHLAFTSLGPGHYDALVLKATAAQSTDVTKCRCGINSNKENYIACAHQNGRHSACRCLAKGQGCSSLCACKGCLNPNGKKSTGTKSKRSREPHKWQSFNTSNKSFAMDAGQLLAQGVWSDYENIVFANVMRHVESDVATLSSLFHSIVKHINAPYCSIELPKEAVLRDKTAQQIAGKLNHYEKEKSLFEQISE